jgi:hypothetical protein
MAYRKERLLTYAGHARLFPFPTPVKPRIEQ